MNGSVFMVQNPEGEIYSIDTNDVKSPFYGSGWQRVFEANEKNEFLRGRAAIRRISREDRFSGYTVFIDGDENLRVFLPACKAAYYRDPANDASGKFIAFKIESINPCGAKAGTIIVNAAAPINYVSNRIRNISRLSPGAEIFAVSVDYHADLLAFPIRTSEGSVMIFTPVSMALSAALASGNMQSDIMNANPDNLTGCFWRLRIVSGGDGFRMAVPLEVWM